MRHMHLSCPVKLYEWMSLAFLLLGFLGKIIRKGMFSWHQDNITTNIYSYLAQVTLKLYNNTWKRIIPFKIILLVNIRKGPVFLYCVYFGKLSPFFYCCGLHTITLMYNMILTGVVYSIINLLHTICTISPIPNIITLCLLL